MSWLTWTLPVPAWVFVVLFLAGIGYFYVWPVIREIDWSWPRG